MSHQATINKLKARPPASDLKWTKLTSFLKSLGFRLVEGAGSRVKFFHADTRTLIILHKPHPNPDVCKDAVAYIRDTLLENGFEL